MCARDATGSIPHHLQTSYFFVMMQKAAVSYPELWSHWKTSIFSSKYRQLASRRLSLCAVMPMAVEELGVTMRVVCYAVEVVRTDAVLLPGL